MKKSQNKIYTYIGLALALLTLVAYWEVKDNEFIQFDDPQYITINPYVKAGITPESIYWAFSTLHIDAFYWHPITWLSHMLDCQLFGLNARWHHVTGLIIHIFNTLLLFVLLSYTTRRIWPSAFVAALFALHPLHVESVAWAAERKDLLSALFWILANIAYTYYVRRPTFGRYLLALLLFALGLMSKPMVVTLPFVWLLLDYWPFERISHPMLNNNDAVSSGHLKKKRLSSLLIEKIPFFILSGTVCIITWMAQREVGALKSTDTFPLSARLANSITSYVSYIDKMLFPHDLAVVYPFTITNISNIRTLLSGLLLVGMTFMVLRYSRKYKYLFVGWFWYLGTLVPVIGLSQVGWQVSADRFTYIPLIGLFIIVAWGIPDLIKWKHKTWLLGSFAGAVLTLLTISTSLQVRYWRNTETLFTLANKVTKDNYVAYTVLSTLSTDTRESYNLLRTALALKPDYYYAHCHLGIIYAVWDELEKAIYHHKEALRLRPDYFFAHHSLAEVYCMQKRYSEALDHFTQALCYRLEWDSPVNNVILLLLNHKDYKFKHLERTIQVLEDINAKRIKRPNMIFALSVAYYNAGRYTDAILIAEKAQKLAVNKGQHELAASIQKHIQLFDSTRIETINPEQR